VDLGPVLGRDAVALVLECERVHGGPLSRGGLQGGRGVRPLGPATTVAAAALSARGMPTTTGPVARAPGSGPARKEEPCSMGGGNDPRPSVTSRREGTNGRDLGSRPFVSGEGGHRGVARCRSA